MSNRDVSGESVLKEIFNGIRRVVPKEVPVPPHETRETFTSEFTTEAEAPNKKKRELAKIHYRKLDENTFQIIGLDGFLSRADIAKKHGARVLGSYIVKGAFMFLDRETGLVVEGPRRFPLLIPGALYDKESFSMTIKLAKECGVNLSRIIKAFQGKRYLELTDPVPGMPKTIEI